MIDISDKNEQEYIGLLYSTLGHRCMEAGDVEAMKFLYGRIQAEYVPAINAINLLQYNLPADIIKKDNQSKYGNEFLYYWGMACIGELSELITCRLDIAEACFKKIKNEVAISEARIAYINLIKSDEPNDDNELEKYNAHIVKNVEILQEWTGKNDVFSMVALAKITHYNYLCSLQSNVKPKKKHLAQLNQPLEENISVSSVAINLLDKPCKLGYPIAINLYKSIMEDAINTCKNQEAYEKYMNLINELNYSADINILYDYGNYSQACN